MVEDNSFHGTAGTRRYGGTDSFSLVLANLPFHSHLTLSPKDSSFHLVTLVTLCLRNLSRLSYLTNCVHGCCLMGRDSRQILLSCKYSDRSGCGSSPSYHVSSVGKMGSKRNLSVISAFYLFYAFVSDMYVTIVRVSFSRYCSAKCADLAVLGCSGKYSNKFIARFSRNRSSL